MALLDSSASCSDSTGALEVNVQKGGIQSLPPRIPPDEIDEAHGFDNQPGFWHGPANFSSDLRDLEVGSASAHQRRPERRFASLLKAECDDEFIPSPSLSQARSGVRRLNNQTSGDGFNAHVMVAEAQLNGKANSQRTEKISSIAEGWASLEIIAKSSKDHLSKLEPPNRPTGGAGRAGWSHFPEESLCEAEDQSDKGTAMRNGGRLQISGTSGRDGHSHAHQRLSQLPIVPGQRNLHSVYPQMQNDVHRDAAADEMAEIHELYAANGSPPSPQFPHFLGHVHGAGRGCEARARSWSESRGWSRPNAASSIARILSRTSRGDAANPQSPHGPSIHPFEKFATADKLNALNGSDSAGAVANSVPSFNRSPCDDNAPSSEMSLTLRMIAASLAQSNPSALKEALLSSRRHLIAAAGYLDVAVKKISEGQWESPETYALLLDSMVSSIDCIAPRYVDELVDERSEKIRKPIVLAHPDEFRNPSSFLKIYGDPQCNTKPSITPFPSHPTKGKNGNWNCPRCNNINYPRRFRCNNSKCRALRDAEGDRLVSEYARQVFHLYMESTRRRPNQQKGKGQSSATAAVSPVLFDISHSGFLQAPNQALHPQQDLTTDARRLHPPARRHEGSRQREQALWFPDRTQTSPTPTGMRQAIYRTSGSDLSLDRCHRNGSVEVAQSRTWVL